jgi:hypothetical protein
VNPWVLGFRGGSPGLDPARNQTPLQLTAEFVIDLHRQGERREKPHPRNTQGGAREKQILISYPFTSGWL